MTIYEALKARLNREPTRAEIKAEVQRILDAAFEVTNSNAGEQK